MRILHINTTDITGGAGIAAYRLHKALRSQGVESFMLVQSKRSNDASIIKSSNIPFINKIREEADKLFVKFALKNKNNLFSVSLLSDNTIKRIKKINPDIIHLHWIAGGFVKIETLAKLNKPVIWSLHDMWPFTGACHYTDNCLQYTHSCNLCPFLKPKSKLAEKTFNRKLKTYQKIKYLYVNGLSKWIMEQAKKSSLFENRAFYNLTNCINTTDFYPINKNKAKKNLNIPENKKVILFGAVAATVDKRKGFDLFQKALSLTENKSDKIVAVFGSPDKKNIEIDGFEYRYLGKINSTEQLRTIYSSADVTVVPSRQENLSNVVLEAMACGTPVVAFNTGGMPDMIKHLQNGYLAKCFSSKDLEKGISKIIYSNDYKTISETAYLTVKSKFDCSVVALGYIDLYEQILGM